MFGIDPNGPAELGGQHLLRAKGVDGDVRERSAIGAAGHAANAVRSVLDDEGTRRREPRPRSDPAPSLVHHAKGVLNDHGGRGVGQVQRNGIDAESAGRNLGIDRRESGYQNRVNGRRARECLRHHGPAGGPR